MLDGGDTGLVNSGNGHVALVRLSFGVVWNELLVRLEMAWTPCWVLKEQAHGAGFFWIGAPGTPGFTYRGRSSAGVGWWVVGWLFVENCTVDASIFVVKLSRANGGCLGTRSR